MVHLSWPRHIERRVWSIRHGREFLHRCCRPEATAWVFGRNGEVRRKATGFWRFGFFEPIVQLVAFQSVSKLSRRFNPVADFNVSLSFRSWENLGDDTGSTVDEIEANPPVRHPVHFDGFSV